MDRRVALAVDPDPEALRTLAAELDALGLATVMLEGAEPAMARIGDDGVVLVLLAADAPGSRALVDAARRRCPPLPAIVTAARSALGEAVGLAPFDVLAKPLDTGELRLRVARALAEERWQRTRSLLARLGEDLASAPPVRAARLVADALLAATEGLRAGVILRHGDGLVAEALAGSAGPDAALAALADAATAARAPRMARVPEGVVLATPLGAGEGALVTLQPPEVPSPGEVLDHLALVATVAAGPLASAHARVRQRDAALEAVRRLVSRAAHELNNPLGGVKLYARLIEQRFAKSSDTYGAGLAQKVEQASDRLSALIAGLAAHGRTPETARAPVAVNALLREVLDRVRDRLNAGAVETTVELGETVGKVHAEPDALRGAFLQLIANALDATPAGGRLTVATRRSDGDTVEVVVADTGAGMDAETRARALELFFTSRPNAAGLGLATACSAVESFGGRLELESEPGGGTRVTVRLPAASP